MTKFTVREQPETGAPNGLVVEGGVREYYFPRLSVAQEIAQREQGDWHAAALFAIRYYDMTKGAK